jgi:hypothetical protein
VQLDPVRRQSRLACGKSKNATPVTRAFAYTRTAAFADAVWIRMIREL